jgi:DsbC/DsbD-like thiol-disulfide interchange protein
MKHHRLLENVTHLAALASLVGFFFIAPPADAAQSQWVHAEGGAIRIVAGGQQPDGTIPAILDIRLNPGWKTYWLDPGASGIAPQVSFDAKDGIFFSGMRFPAPKSFGEGIGSYTGYDKYVAFPLLLKSDKNGDLSLKASVFLGICKDICIPVQAELSLSLPDGVADILDEARIEDAVAALPAQPSETFKVKAASFDAAGKRLRLSLVTPGVSTGTAPELFLAGPPGYSFGKPENVTMANGEFTAELPVRVPAKGGALKSGSVLLVARSGERSMETPLAFD